jgi:hypothetical protein
MPTNQEELFDLLGSLCNGSIAPEQQRRLQELLEASQANRQFYFDYLDLHLQLKQWQQTEKNRGDCPNFRINENGTVPFDATLEADREMRSVDAALEPIRGDGGRRGETPIRGDSLSPPPPSVTIPPIVIQPVPTHLPSAFSLNAPLGGMLFSYAVSALLVCLGMLIGWTWKVSASAPLDVFTPVHMASAEKLSPKMTIVGQITGMIGCKFSDDRDILPPPGNHAHVPLGRKYKLDSGLMEIAYDTGAKVILQGPVTYEVESASGGYLSIGRLTARVENAKPQAAFPANYPSNISDIQISPALSPLSPLPSPLFSVRTPTALVTDLGTEFGVDVDRSGQTASHVFRGKVAMAALADGGEKQGREVVLGENESAQVERPSGGDGSKIVVRRGKVNPEDYVRSEQFLAKAKEAKELPMKPYRHWKAFSNELRKRGDLLAYYDFQRDPNVRRDETNSEVLPNRSAAGKPYDGQLRGAVQWAKGRFAGKHAMQFGFSDDDGIHIVIPAECKQITLAAWVNLDTFSRPIITLLASDGFNVSGKLHWIAFQDGRMLTGFFGSKTEERGYSPPVFDKSGLGKWRFVAVVCDPPAGKITYYLDGKLLGEASIEADSGTIKLGSAMIGAWEPLNIPCPRDRRIEGRMDELMIFRSALPPEEMRTIYEGTRE